MLLEETMTTSQQPRNGSLGLRRKGGKKFWKREFDFGTRAGEIVLDILLVSSLSQGQPHPGVSVKSSLRRY